ncbi:glycosyl hydrolase family 18 protein [Streptomyces noursei]|uniref:glycosyl hydrolase family 18 protein n=1 Tax=Streptomyces noursei TaxID=1971 RepID=UPI0023B8249A|nr:glycosyl hydrolase family 18 protein [Streptomyces noursei]
MTETAEAWSGQSGAGPFLVAFGATVYRNQWWTDATQVPGEWEADPANNPWRPERAATVEEAKLGQAARASHEGGSGWGALEVHDPSTAATWQQVGFTPDGSGTPLSYTSTRVNRPVYNEFKPADSTAPILVAVLAVGAQYDGRPQGSTQPADAGPGFDLTTMRTTYDHVVVQSHRLDEGGTAAAAVARSRDGWNRQSPGAAALRPGAIVLADPWGALATSVNTGQPTSHMDLTHDNYLRYYKQDVAAGLLGGLRDMKTRNPQLKLVFNVSGCDPRTACFTDPAGRKAFVDSITDVFARFPMFDAVQLDTSRAADDLALTADWDPKTLPLVVAELRKALDTRFGQGTQKTIDLAVRAADTATLDRYQLPELISQGLDRVFLQAWGFASASLLTHDANLAPLPSTGTSGQALVRHLTGQLQIPASAIVLGYTATGTSAAGADPATATLTPAAHRLGTFTEGRVAFHDALANYLAPSDTGLTGKNGFVLHSDGSADALFNPDTRHFISLDTPRTVQAKAAYALQQNLGGLCTWDAHHDNGLLANAANDGLARTRVVTTLDDTALRNTGTPVTIPAHD